MVKRRVIIAGLATVAACGILAFGMNINNQNPGDIKEPVHQGEVSKEPIQQGITGKVKVNIEGTITEVSKDGKSFKLDDNLWVDVTEETELGISGPTAAPKEEQFFDEEFKVGNSIAGFTLEDVESDRVKAYVIYSNWNWELEKK